MSDQKSNMRAIEASIELHETIKKNRKDEALIEAAENRARNQPDEPPAPERNIFDISSYTTRLYR